MRIPFSARRQPSNGSRSSTESLQSPSSARSWLSSWTWRRRAALVVLGAVSATPLARAFPLMASTPAVTIHRAHQAHFRPAPNRPVFFLVLGSDTGTPMYHRGGSMDRGRSDAIHLVGVNPTQHRATILDFPRDSHVPIPGHGTDKLNSAMAYGGPDLTVRTVEALTGVRIDYYLLTNFDGVVKMVDELGGLDVNVDRAMHDSFSGSNFSAGMNHMNGTQVLSFCRDRHSAYMGDFGRSKHQGDALIAGLAKYRKAIEADPADTLSYLRTMLRYVHSDLPLRETYRFALLAQQIDPTLVRNFVMPGTTGPAGGASVVFLSAEKDSIFADFRNDAILQSN